jgi:hypothetical protein
VVADFVIKLQLDAALRINFLIRAETDNPWVSAYVRTCSSSSVVSRVPMGAGRKRVLLPLRLGFAGVVAEVVGSMPVIV